MLSGVKFIPRDQIDREGGEKSDASARERVERGGSVKDKFSRKKTSRYVSSNEDDSIDDSYDDKRKRSKRRGSKKKKISHCNGSDSEFSGKKRNRRRNRKEYSSEDDASPFESEGSGSDDYSSDKDSGQKSSQKGAKRRDRKGVEGTNSPGNDFDDQKIVRKEMGLEWMLMPGDRKGKGPIATDDVESLETPKEEVEKINPRELNPYLKDGGTGYPEEEEDSAMANGGNLPSSSVVGDGGASWRLKALKRAQEHAAREGRKLNEVVAERWGSVGELAVSVSAGGVAPSRAHLRAINERRKGKTEDRRALRTENTGGDDRKNNRDYLKDVSVRNAEMRVPKVRDSLSWGKQRTQYMPPKDAAVISAAVSSLNKFSNDGSFMQEALRHSKDDVGVSTSCEPTNNEPNLNEGRKLSEVIQELPEGLTANQMAAKAMQLRMKGKNEEAEKLLQEVEKLKSRQLNESLQHGIRNERPATRYDLKDRSSSRKKDDDADLHLARSIMQNKQYSMSGRADDEYDCDGAPSKRSKKKSVVSRDSKVTQTVDRRFMTQQERCLFCFENPNRPKHLVISIANFTYLMLPQHQPVAPGHCCILTLQHDSSTRTVDDDVWDEFWNFKKCLIMMFAKQEKELVFLEMVMGLAQQRRHCLIECIPLPADIAKEAPLYFKKAIDEAEDEWSQHNAKKLIDTTAKGLRSSIPKDFPYFHVEFGLNRGFVHVTEDEDRFKSGFGLNVVRGMLKSPEEDMHRRRQRYESADAQKQSVSAFAREWQLFDWTKQLD